MDRDGLIASLSDFLDGLWASLITYLPHLLTAGIVLILGWGMAMLLRFIATRLSERIQGLITGRAIGHELRESGVGRLAPEVVGRFVFWVVFLLFVAAAGHIMGLDSIPAAVGRLVQYLPSVLAAVLVVFAGIILGTLARGAITSAAERAGIAQGAFLGQTARVIILTVAGVVALDQVGIESTLLILILGIVLGTGIGGVALAFGLGARDSVSGFIAAQEIVQVYKIGDRIAVGDVRGEIIEFTRTAVVLDTEDGRARMPATEFIRRTSFLLESERS